MRIACERKAHRGAVEKGTLTTNHQSLFPQIIHTSELTARRNTVRAFAKAIEVSRNHPEV